MTLMLIFLRLHVYIFAKVSPDDRVPSIPPCLFLALMFGYAWLDYNPETPGLAA